MGKSCRGDPAKAVLHGGKEVRWLWGFGRHGDTPVEARLLVPGYRSFDSATRAGDNQGDGVDSTSVSSLRRARILWNSLRHLGRLMDVARALFQITPVSCD